MSGLLSALTSIAAAAATQSAISALRRLAWNAVGVLFILIGFGFAIGAGYEALWIRYGALEARLITAGIFAVIGALIFLIAYWQAAARRRRAANGTAAAVGTAFALGILGGLGRKKS